MKHLSLLLAGAAMASLFAIPVLAQNGSSDSANFTGELPQLLGTTPLPYKSPINKSSYYFTLLVFSQAPIPTELNLGVVHFAISQ